MTGLEQAAGGVVGVEDGAGGVGGEDGDGTAADEDVELLLRLAAGEDFGFDGLQVKLAPAAVGLDFVDEESNAAEGGEVQEVAGQRDGGGPGEAVELLRQQRARDSDNGNLDASEQGSRERHGKQVEKTERDVGIDTPVDERDDQD